MTCSHCGGTGQEPNRSKRCKKCTALKAYDAFLDQSANVDGKSCYCRDCEELMLVEYRRKAKSE